jgi:hypothetical protein
MASSCNVCADDFNKMERCKLICTHCEFETCAKCAERYFETSMVAPQCMHCHRPWKHEYILDTLGSSCIKRVQKLHKERLFQEQKAMFPQTQPLVVLAKDRETLDVDMKALKAQIKALRVQVYEKNIAINHNVYQVNRIVNPRTTIDPTAAQEKPKAFLRPCSQDKCHGFVGEDDSCCELCKTEYCTKCMCEKTEDHVCDQNDILTLRLLKNDTKPCPKCSIPIHRIDGCHDMFCVMCNTAFNWTTLLINNKGNSNPHFYEWLRTTGGGVTGTNVCGRNVSIQNVFSHLRNNLIPETDADSVTICIRSIQHAVTAENQKLLYQNIGSLTRYYKATLELRIKFMRNKVTDVMFKRELMRIHKAIEFNRNVKQIIRLIRDYNQDIMNTAIAPDFETQSWLEQYLRFVVYVNGCYADLRKVFYGDGKATSKDTYKTCVLIPRYVKTICKNYSQIVEN